MPDLTLTKTRTDSCRYRGKDVSLPRYEVALDGKVVGTVYKTMITRERRTPGRRYVNARWESPGWRAGAVGQYGLVADSRRDGITRLLRLHTKLSWDEITALVDSVATVR